jgi:tetratricopeptide (TPR) repeat protein
LCLERVASLLLQEKPRPEHLQEAERLLNLIVSQRPALAPSCSYWRAVTFTHERRLHDAVEQLAGILKLPQDDTPSRRSVHFKAWQLALLLHPELERRVGLPLLAQSGERMDAITAVERQLALVPNDPPAWDLKRLLYSEMHEGEYNAAIQSGQAAANFDHDYTKQLGLALVDDAQRWERGCEYLRIAARGLPDQAPGIYIQIAQAHEKHGDHPGLWSNYQRAMQIGRGFGVKNLSSEERQNLFGVVKKIGEQAIKEERLDTALDAYKFYSQFDGAGLETYRTLAELFEKKQDFWNALHCTEHALTYNGQDADLLERKDRYYYNLMPADVQARLEQVRGWFDTHYCIEKTRWLLERFNGNLDLLEWAGHLAALTQVVEPDNLSARFLRARIHRLRGEIPETIEVLEAIRQYRPAKFASSEDERSWYFTHRLLGELYLDDKPDQAVLCLQEFNKSMELSGADTYFKLGRAYENLGDFLRAARAYEQVTGYEQHPLYYEARDAVERLRARR